jgi:glucose/arabinose dehydrogenase
LFVAEQEGTIMMVDSGRILSEPFLDIRDLVPAVNEDNLEDGILGMAFHPDFAENGQFFVHYNRSGDHATVIARYTVSADQPYHAVPESGEIILTHAQPNWNHDGGQLEFGPDGYLYIGLGDGGPHSDPNNQAQTKSSLLGKILRIDVNGDLPFTIPPDNPAYRVDPALAPEVWAWGLRNPWRFSFDPATGDLYIADVGQFQWEEVNFQAADSPGGENYGWRVWEGRQRYTPADADPENAVFPVLEYGHSQGCSITGGYVYRGEAMPELQGYYIYGDYCSGRTWAAFRDAGGEWQTAPFLNSEAAIVSFGRDEAGEIYLVDYRGGLLKLYQTR